MKFIKNNVWWNRQKLLEIAQQNHIALTDVALVNWKMLKRLASNEAF